MKKTIIIDCDTGVDDALAILYCLTNPDLEVKLISCVCGNVEVDMVAKNSFFVSRWINNSLAIVSGASKPLVKEFNGGVVMGATGLGSVSPEGAPENYPEATMALKELIESNLEPIIILAIGPLTNLSILFGKYPELIGKVDRLFILGGSLNNIGNMNRAAEFNFYIDPEAADHVLSLGIPITLIPLERCHETTIPLDKFKTLNDKLYFPKLWQILLDYQKAQKAEKHTEIVAYDALAAYVMANPGKYKTEKYDVVVETEGKYTRGMSVAELREYKSKNYNVDLVTQVDRQDFINNFFQTIGGKKDS